MLAYQSGIAKFDASETKVFGISTDNTPSQKEFAAKNSVQFPLLSDFSKRKVSADYGVLLVDSGMANRSTFVIWAGPQPQLTYELTKTRQGSFLRAICSPE